MRVPVKKLHGDTVRLPTPALDISGGIREPVDALTDGRILDGWRRVEAARLAGIEEIAARVWACESSYWLYQKLLTEAHNRDLDPTEEDYPNSL